MAANTPKQSSLPADVEHHFILRVPQHTAEDLRRFVQSGSQNLKDYLTIETHSDMRHGLVHIDEETFAAKLVDLPTMIETHKTFDKKTFWKTADVSQMLVCSVEDAPILPEDEPKPGPVKKPEKVDKKFIWKHGVTPPLKNVRKRRFRKTAKKKYIEAPDVEEEVKRLLRMDSTAIKIKWEVLAEDNKDDKNDDSIGSPPHGDALHDMFGEVSSSEDEQADDEEEEDMDVNIEDLDETSNAPTLPGRGSPRVLMEGEDESTMDGGGPGEDDEDEMEEEGEERDDEDEDDEEDDTGEQQENELAKRLSELKDKLMEEEGRKKALEESVANVDNPMLKQRFQDQLEDLLSDMKRKQEEVETLQVIVGSGR